ncbi:CubicO group peptidase (beta-lactamase class C family) [Murinocardiopsis flavida]|uniref:CubicO group peptidase (Beta-lactamase class C family) n=1 Tax=Murinocardiopsis flavida TaxID=645275 RepID=A0A2P8D9F5_9ACTN|nr:serine hydrolase domain-containing protein [Murinocardiopsis flavida]PSK93811.1 CubicO group peptidase (beta-lactamase class C family) [Murinocardiopsis flavida]
MSGPAALLAAARGDRVFSAAAWSIGGADGPVDRGLLGTVSWGGAPVAEDSLWDLASVTKPIAAIAVLALVERGVLGLGDTIGDHLPGYRGGDKAAVTVHQLLTHASGLPGRTPLFWEHPDRGAWLDTMRTSPLPAPTGSRIEYSSQGFILAGMIAEAASGTPLDRLVAELVTGPLGMASTMFRPGPADRLRAVATEECAWRGHLVMGEVHDENAVVLDRAAGHAGLFSTLADMERLGGALAAGGGALLGADAFARMASERVERGGQSWGLGWMRRDSMDSPAGCAIGPGSYGHTGFTGTSLWVDPDAGRYYVLLTNRVHPTRDNPAIVALRRDFHTAAAGSGTG